MYCRSGMEEPETPRGKRCRKLGQLRRTETDGTRQGEDEARQVGKGQELKNVPEGISTKAPYSTRSPNNIRILCKKDPSQRAKEMKTITSRVE